MCSRGCSIIVFIFVFLCPLYFYLISFAGESGDRGTAGIQGGEGVQGERGERGRGEPGVKVTSMVHVIIYSFFY